jgi:hypothetical protein
MDVRLYSMPGSHAATTGELLLRRKGIAYKRTDLLPVVSWLVLKALEGSKIGMPHKLAGMTAGPFIALDARSRGATDENVRAAIAALPAMLQRIDGWIAEGVLGGEALNAADLQIAPSLRLAMSLDDLRPAIESRPAGRLATRVVEHFPGRTPAVLPREWLTPLA